MEKILTELAHQQAFRIEESTGIGEARRYAARLAEALAFNATLAGELAIVVTEAATNILRHAGSGELLLRPLRGARGNGIEVLAIDPGPGIADIGHSLRDGVSTAGTPGSGLGAMQRLAAEFALYSFPGKGTVLYLALWADDAVGDVAGAMSAALQVGVISLPKPREQVCGDGWMVSATEEPLVLAVVDGLGHGPDAAAASRAVLDTLRDRTERTPARLLELAHQRARPTRGAAVAFAVLQRREAATPGPLQLAASVGTRSLQFAGVGNIAASVLSGDLPRQQLISHNGIVGHNLRKVQEVGAKVRDGDLLVMHSDGLAMHWDLSAYPGLITRHPAVIAAVLYRDFSRGNDDVTVLIARCVA